MSFFARASWPGDHRDEVVAGALVAAVVVVLGYASGIGVSTPPTVDTAAPPASPAPSATHQPTARSETGPPDTSAGTTGSGTAGGYWAGGGDAGIPVAGGTSPTGGAGGHDHGTGGEGGGTGSTSPSPAPTPPPSPTPSDSCQEGEVSLVKPLLNGVATPVTGLLDGLLAPSASPSPSPSASAGTDTLSSLCVGVASPSVLPELLP
ncbi:hypothetical protein ACWC09_40360 [Streptomyces sp. NPDC001617]